ncbi:MAG: O-methyltransferase [Salibacteraceae bacterium]
MDFLPPEIEWYAEEITSPESPLLNELNRFTHTSVLQPRMLAGHLQGRIIAMFSKMIQPRRVLEIGTYTGYSALCWAEGLVAGGSVHTIEIDDELEPKIRSFFNRSPYADRIVLHIGSALEVIPGIDGPFDVVYIDADKVNYCAYFDLVIDNVVPGGFIIADNVLWSGKVIDPEANDPDTQALRNYAEKIKQDDRVEQVLLPVRDGLLISRKLEA